MKLVLKFLTKALMLAKRSYTICQTVRMSQAQEAATAAAIAAAIAALAHLLKVTLRTGKQAKRIKREERSTHVFVSWFRSF